MVKLMQHSWKPLCPPPPDCLLLLGGFCERTALGCAVLWCLSVYAYADVSIRSTSQKDMDRGLGCSSRRGLDGSFRAKPNTISYFCVAKLSWKNFSLLKYSCGGFGYGDKFSDVSFYRKGTWSVITDLEISPPSWTAKYEFRGWLKFFVSSELSNLKSRNKHDRLEKKIQHVQGGKKGIPWSVARGRWVTKLELSRSETSDGALRWLKSIWTSRQGARKATRTAPRSPISSQPLPPLWFGYLANLMNLLYLRHGRRGEKSAGSERTNAPQIMFQTTLGTFPDTISLLDDIFHFFFIKYCDRKK